MMSIGKGFGRVVQVAYLVEAFVAGVELPCTGAPYMAIILLLSQNFDFVALLMLLLYNLIFVAPLLVILFLAYGGIKIHHIKKWKMKYRPPLKTL